MITGPEYLMGRGQFAIVSDAQQATLVLLNSESGDPVDTEVQPGDWLWIELWTRDLNQAAGFYKALAGYQLLPNEAEGLDKYFVFEHKDIKRAGVVELPWQTIKPNWLPYVRVKDIQQTVEKTRQLGGRVIIEPDASFGAGRIAVITDPTGGVLGIQEFESQAVIGGVQ